MSVQLWHILGAQFISNVINNNEKKQAGRGGVKKEGFRREFFLAHD